MQLKTVENYEEMSRLACSVIIQRIQQLDNPVLGLATGSTPEGLYKQMIEQYKQKNVSFESVRTFNLDEYVGLTKEDEQSYDFYMKDNLFQHIDIDQANTHLPNGVAADLEKECIDYEARIEQAGGIDVQVLGIGLNGHIGFNEPGTNFSSRTHIIDLAPSTRKANARFFEDLAEVPEKAITMGIETIMQSKEILLLVSGEKKAEAVSRMIEGEISEEFPASILQKHPNVTVIGDKAALSLL
ncbi:glucosamine-6-phosphate deaminase [Oceanobacillus jordanicus]|uniref:Glucosamine-6-phosphate deaminase n=1 Tax=Oceanobacillus jordanicus TaxID=2867266 RepID=A0AAW5BAQ8_9BACI|nr:glucosamine-6-phosphate deaminase [Oceanobacillus jordanicus]MCG3420585.1 glucosamine-6-phosphate deaminase [Oceanobacillus jordanicus]NAP00353.1 glucosamine-6-phosphate deaminase [Halomonas sp. MG34]